MKTLLALALSLLAGAASVRAATNHIIAGPFTNLANGHYYYLLKTATWTTSEDWAVSYGGHLATVRDADENQWLVDTFAHYGGVNRPLWIGLTDRAVEGTFAWVSGEPVVYSNWNHLSGEPNNSGGSGYEEDFTYIIQQNSGNPTVLATYWNDVPNDGYGVIPHIYGIMETTNIVDTMPPTIPPPTAHVRFSCLEVCWQSMSNAQYQVEYKNTGTTNWVNLGPVVTGTGGELCVTDSPRGTNRLYRVEVVVP